MKIDAAGITPTDLSGYVAELERVFRDALGATLNLAPETPQGQLIGIDALARAHLDEVAVAVAGGMSLNTASGTQLDAIGSILSIPRLPATRSVVTATLTGAAGTVLPAGTQARTAAGAAFALAEQAVVGTDGEVSATMQAVETGPVVAAAGTLTNRVQAITGWEGVTNPADAVLGRAAETDARYRARYLTIVARGAATGLEAIAAAVRAVQGVADTRIEDNATGAAVTLQGVTIPAGALWVCVQGGRDEDVARAILETRPVGTPTVGGVTVQVPHAGGRLTAIRFERVVLDPVTVAVSIRIRPDFTADGIVLIRERLAQWVAGTYEAAPGRFDTSGQAIGEVLDETRLSTPINSVTGHSIVSIAVNLKAVEGVVEANTDTVEYVYRATADDTAPATPSGGATEDDFVPTDWSAASIDPTAALPYVWRSTRTQSDDAWTANDFAAPELWARGEIPLPDPPDLNHRFTLAEDDVTVTVSTS